MQQSSNNKENDKKPGLSWSTPSTNAPASLSKQQAPTTPMTLPTMSPNNGNATARYVGIFVGGLIVGVVFAWGYSALMHKGSTVATNSMNTTNAATSSASSMTTKKSTTVATTKTNTSVASDVVLESAELTVASPQTAGQSVRISNVDVSKPTWVVVYDNTDGKPGNVLGAQLFFSTGSGTVTLLRPTMAGKTYLVGRSIDNGDRKFQKATDTAVVDANGTPVLATFTAK